MHAAPAVALLAGLLLSACSNNSNAPAPTVETRAPDGAGQSPAFGGQTRAPRRSAEISIIVQTVARGLDHPWSLAFLPDGRMLVTERPGRLRIVSAKGEISQPALNAPKVLAENQGGLFDVVLDPAFPSNGLVYLSYLEPRVDGSGLTVARAKLVEANGQTTLENLTEIFRAQPSTNSTANIGGRLAFAPDGALFVTVGDRFTLADKAQTLDNDLGKVIRIEADGSIPPSNPFVAKAPARPEIWSYGHRNAQSAAINPTTGKLWTVEHGPKGGDELNIPEAGKNYGWPIITYGVDYSGKPVGGGFTAGPDMEQPLYYWDPVIAPSGMLFYTGDLFPDWKGSLFIGSLKQKHLARLTLNGERVVGEERLLGELGFRIRDVRQGPDGALYILTDEDNGEVLRVIPKAVLPKKS